MSNSASVKGGATLFLTTLTRVRLPITAPVARVLEHLAAEGRIRPISGRAFHFLVAHGAAAPFTLQALAREIEPSDPLDPVERAAYIDMVVEVVLAGIRLDASGR